MAFNDDSESTLGPLLKILTFYNKTFKIYTKLGRTVYYPLPPTSVCPLHGHSFSVCFHCSL